MLRRPRRTEAAPLVQNAISFRAVGSHNCDQAATVTLPTVHGRASPDRKVTCIIVESEKNKEPKTGRAQAGDGKNKGAGKTKCGDRRSTTRLVLGVSSN